MRGPRPRNAQGRFLSNFHRRDRCDYPGCTRLAVGEHGWALTPDSPMLFTQWCMEHSPCVVHGNLHARPEDRPENYDRHLTDGQLG